MEIYKEIFNDIFPLSEKSFNELKVIFIPVNFPKNELFIKEGSRNHSEYFIVDGYCRSYLVNPDGEDITLAFFKPHDVISPHIIRTKNDISLLNFQALTDVDLVSFDSTAFLNLMIENIELRDFGNTILKNELIRKMEKEIALASHTAKERLMNFRKDFRILENLVAHPVIASYLGITNVSLSRLRGELK